MSQLLRRGFIAALAPTGVPNCDIIVTDEIGDKLCAIQVKTRNNAGADGGWHMGKKHESLDGPNLFYCFVDFYVGTIEAPGTYVVPARVVAAALSESHQTWLDQPGKRGQQRKDNDLRRFLPGYDQLGLKEYLSGWLDIYREAWHLLNESAD